MLWLAQMYITLLPAVLAGVGNMVWCSLPFGKALCRPIDGGRKLKDGERIFGDNKTWKGFIGMMVLGVAFTIIWGLVCRQVTFLGHNNYLYYTYKNTLPYNALMGLAFGFAYALFELPNSFIKRRLGVVPGNPPKGPWRFVGIFFDQADSVFGVVLVVALVYPMSLWFYLFYVLVGAATHIVFNVLLYLVHLRKNPF